MNKKSIHLCNLVVPALLILILAIAPLFSGCIGFEGRTNISIDAPGSMEVVGRKVETLVIELVPDEADAKNVVVNLSAPPGISLTDPHTGFQQYSVELKNIPKGKKERIYFNYSATFFSDEYDLILEVKADNSNDSKRVIKVNLSVPVPEWDVGEYWILNQTMGDFEGTRMQQILRKESQSGKEVYVIKDTLAREVTGNYRLYYYSVEDLAHVKTEYYEEDKIIERMTESIDPPSLLYGFPFKVGKRWNWIGTISGIGKTEIKGEIIEKKKISLKGISHDTYRIKLKYVYPLGTSVWETWYSPDVKGLIMEKGSVNMGAIVKEINTEFVEHGVPPGQPRYIQPLLNAPAGLKPYNNDDFGIHFNYPIDWKVNKTSMIYITDSKDKLSVFISKEPIGKLTLKDYAEKVNKDLYIYEENYTEVNGRIGYKISGYLRDVGFIYAVIFVANENGYVIFNIYGGGANFPPETVDIINSLVIDEPIVYSSAERK